jgi:hypothetical protein
MGGTKNFDKRGSSLISADQSATTIDGFVSEALIDKPVLAAYVIRELRHGKLDEMKR